MTINNGDGSGDDDENDEGEDNDDVADAGDYGDDNDGDDDSVRENGHPNTVKTIELIRMMTTTGKVMMLPTHRPLSSSCLWFIFRFL